MREGRAYLAHEHLDSPFQEKEATAILVHAVNRDERGNDIHHSGDDSGHKRGVVAKADGLEEDGSVEHDDVYACELLKEGDGECHDQLWPVLA